MLVNDLHSSYESPPNVPIITGAIQKPSKKDSLSETIAGAAAALIKAVNPQTPSSAADVSTNKLTVSPGILADTRMKYFQQLRYLKQLFEDSILTEQEYVGQKNIIIEALHNL